MIGEGHQASAVVQSTSTTLPPPPPPGLRGKRYSSMLLDIRMVTIEVYHTHHSILEVSLSQVKYNAH